MLWPLVIYTLVVLSLVAAMLALSWALGEHHHQPQTDTPYESGIVSTRMAPSRHYAQFYLYAMFFVIFDLETVFILIWAVAGKELGWPGYIQILVFMIVMLAALVYLIGVKALDFSKKAEITARKSSDGTR